MSETKHSPFVVPLDQGSVTPNQPLIKDAQGQIPSNPAGASLPTASAHSVNLSLGLEANLRPDLFVDNPRRESKMQNKPNTNLVTTNQTNVYQVAGVVRSPIHFASLSSWMNHVVRICSRLLALTIDGSFMNHT